MAVYVTNFGVKMPKEESDELKEIIESSDFEYDSLDRFRGNSKYGEFIRYLINSGVLEEVTESADT